MGRWFLWRFRPHVRRMAGITLFVLGTVLALAYVPLWAWICLLGLALAASGLFMLKNY